MKKFYISDTHFGHKNILTYDQRPFFSVEEMEEEMVSLWNGRVTNEDIVYILGDFCWSGKVEEWKRILDRLNGTKMLIRGNHDFPKDHFEGKDLLEDGLEGRFAGVYDYYEADDYIDGQKYRVLMSHYPMPFYKSSWNPKNIMLYGHVHITSEEGMLSDLRKELLENIRLAQGVGNESLVNSLNKAQFFNVGCMMRYMGYGPRELKDIVRDKLLQF